MVPWGLGSALKPSLEPITLARKPRRLTLAANVLAHGTGAMNIDGCRIPATDNTTKAWRDAGERSREQYRTGTSGKPVPTEQGRWPANLILSWPEDEYELREDLTADQRRELFGWLHANA